MGIELKAHKLPLEFQDHEDGDGDGNDINAIILFLRETVDHSFHCSDGLDMEIERTSSSRPFLSLPS